MTNETANSHLNNEFSNFIVPSYTWRMFMVTGPAQLYTVYQDKLVSKYQNMVLPTMQGGSTFMGSEVIKKIDGHIYNLIQLQDIPGLPTRYVLKRHVS